MTFEVNTVSTRTLEVVMDEADSLNKLIMQREIWLANKENLKSPQYEETMRDTQRMIWDLRDLQTEIQELKKL